jgi:hypothetical protein
MKLALQLLDGSIEYKIQKLLNMNHARSIIEAHNKAIQKFIEKSEFDLREAKREALKLENMETFEALQKKVEARKKLSSNRAERYYNLKYKPIADAVGILQTLKSIG